MARRIRIWFGRYAGDEAGAALVEYGLIVALIVVALVAVMGNVGLNLGHLFSSASGKL